MHRRSNRIEHSLRHGRDQLRQTASIPFGSAIEPRRSERIEPSMAVWSVLSDRYRRSPVGFFNWANQFPKIVDAIRRLPAERIVLDGEAVCLRPDGYPDFPCASVRQACREAPPDGLRPPGLGWIVLDAVAAPRAPQAIGDAPGGGRGRPLVFRACGGRARSEAARACQSPQPGRHRLDQFVRQMDATLKDTRLRRLLSFDNLRTDRGLQPVDSGSTAMDPATICANKP